MATPKKKTSKSRRDMRRAHDAIAIETSGTCKKCGERKRPHHVCPSCGTYNDKNVISK